MDGQNQYGRRRRRGRGGRGGGPGGQGGQPGPGQSFGGNRGGYGGQGGYQGQPGPGAGGGGGQGYRGNRNRGGGGGGNRGRGAGYGGRGPQPGAGQPRGQASRLGEQSGVTGFDLFCAYHLGITADDRYKFQNIHEVARRFNTNAGVIRQLLLDYQMDPEQIVHSTFDLAGAQVDIMVAPEGISRTELARPLYEEFLAAPRKGRNWNQEIEDAALDNERIYGRR